jgi:hypothetical protein
MDVGMADAPTMDVPDVPGLDAPMDTPDAPGDAGDIFCVTCRERSAILLADSQRVVADAAGPTISGSTGASANAIVPNASTLATLTNVGESTIAEGTTFESELGASPITLTSSLQTVIATHDGARYALTGLVGAPVFAAADTLTVSGMVGSSPLSVLVTPPSPITTASSLLDTPSGRLTSSISWPDGECDAFVVVATLAGSTLPGEAQVIRRVACDDAPLEGGRRRIRMLDDATLTELTARGLTVSELTVGVVNEAECAGFFPDLDPGAVVPCQAGRLLRFSPSALEPPLPPACGGPRTSGVIVNICFDFAAGTCSTSVGANPCSGGGPIILRVSTVRLDVQTYYPAISTTVGTISEPLRVTGIPDGSDVTIVQSISDTSTVTASFRLEGTTVTPLGIPIYVP